MLVLQNLQRAAVGFPAPSELIIGTFQAKSLEYEIQGLSRLWGHQTSPILTASIMICGVPVRVCET